METIMQNEFDIKLGKVSCVWAIKTQKLSDYSYNFKYETPHKKQFLFDYTYFGNQDCPHVLNEEVLRLVSDRVAKFSEVILLFRVNNRNKKGLNELVAQINALLNDKSAVVFLCNPLGDLISVFEEVYDLDVGQKREKGYGIDLKPYLVDFDKQSPLYLNIVKGLKYAEIAQILGISITGVKNKIQQEKTKIVESLWKEQYN
jgi:Sigma-70, region 4